MSTPGNHHFFIIRARSDDGDYGFVTAEDFGLKKLLLIVLKKRHNIKYNKGWNYYYKLPGDDYGGSLELNVSRHDFTTEADMNSAIDVFNNAIQCLSYDASKHHSAEIILGSDLVDSIKSSSACVKEEIIVHKRKKF